MAGDACAAALESPDIVALDALDEVVLTCAGSIHKSQGTEYPCVVVPLPMLHHVMMQRHLNYAAITCGRPLIVVVGELFALSRAVAGTPVQRRRMRLVGRLMRNSPSASACMPS